MPAIPFDLDKAPPYEAGARLLAVLAWPELITDKAMKIRHACLCQAFLKNRADEDPVWSITPQPIKPFYWTRPSKLVVKYFRSMNRLVRRRLIAARMAVPFLREAAEMPPGLPACVSRLTLNCLSDLVLSDTEKTDANGDSTEWFDANNVEARIWRPSRPVIHIASALAIVIDDSERGGQKLSYGDVLNDPDLIRSVVIDSEFYAALIPKIRQFTIRSEDLIRLALI